MQNKSKWPFLKAVAMWLNWLTEHIRLIKRTLSTGFINKTVTWGCGCGRNRLPATITLNIIFLKGIIPILFLRIHVLWHSTAMVVQNHVLINIQRGLWQRENRFNSISKKREPIPSKSNIVIRAFVCLDYQVMH